MPGRRRRGVGLLFFALVTLPVAMLCLTLSVDFTRMFLAARQVTSAAESAALAGAYQTTPGTSTLDESLAESIAEETFTVAGDSGVYHLASNSEPEITATTSRVTVAVTYDVAGLLFAGWFMDGNSETFNIERHADVCVPATSGTVDAPLGSPGYCTRPE